MVCVQKTGFWYILLVLERAIFGGKYTSDECFVCKNKKLDDIVMEVIKISVMDLL
jgi:hypothetical protein